MSGWTPTFVDANAVTIPIPVAQPPSPANGPAPLDGARGGLRRHVTDEWLIVLLGAILSVTFLWWYSAHGLTVAFNDARIREMIARRVLMGRTPGLAQLGYTWQPLPQLLMLPLIWNDTLFRDGIAGSLPSMAGYVIAGLYMYRSGRLVAASRWAGWVAAAALLLNPSVLYMQTTPMSEIPALGAYVAAIYYALALMRSHDALDIAKCSAAVAAGTLIRYENWVLGLALVPVLVLAAWRRRGHALAEAWVLLYSVLAFAGCAAWVAYNAAIFHDALLSFFYGQSDHRYYANTPGYMLPARGHPWVALKMYGLTVADIGGWVVTAMAAAGFVLLLCWKRLQLSTLPVYVTLMPFGFYWIVLYLGVNTETIPGLGPGPLYNVRFGLAMIPAIAFGIVGLTIAGPRLLRRVAAGASLLAIAAAYVLVGQATPIVVREAWYGQAGIGTEQPGRAAATWLSSHYHGGNILITYVNNQAMIFYLLTQHGMPDRALITDTNGPQFAGALAQPEYWVTWIVMNSSPRDGTSKIWTTLHGREDWRRYFVLRTTFGPTQIFQRDSPAVVPAGPPTVVPVGSTVHPQSAAPAPPTPSVVLRPLTASALDENSANAGNAIDGNLATAWKTQWYIGDPAFGGLKPGAGLLIDMGHQVRLGSVEVTFGPTLGADVQIKIGNIPREPAMTTVAQASDVGGTQDFALSAATGRYVLIWLTKLPPVPGSAGKYQAEIFDVVLRSPGTALSHYPC